MPKVKSKSFDLIIKSLLKNSIPVLSIDQAKELIESSIFIDARSVHEYNISHIKDSINIPYNNFESDIIINNTKQIIVYCSIGLRSEKLAEKLINKGFNQVYNLYGGIFEWANLNLPLYRRNNEVVQELHVYNWIWGKWLKNKAYKKVYVN